MKKFLTITRYDIIKMFRDKTSLFFMFLLPIAFTIIMGMVFGNITNSEGAYRIPVGVVNNDRGEISGQMLSKFKENQTINVTMKDIKTIYKEVKDVSIAAGFIIPEGFSDKIMGGEAGQIKVVRLPSSVDSMAIQGMLNSALSEVMLKNVAVDFMEGELSQIDKDRRNDLINQLADEIERGMQKEPAMSVESIKVASNREADSYDPKAQISLGYMVMFVMFTIILSSGELLEEKKLNTWNRLLITPVSRGSLMVGKIGANFIKGWMQTAFLIFFGSLVLGVNFGKSLPSTVLLMSIYLISVSGMGIFLASIVKTNAQLGAMSSILIITTSMMSGLWWPIEMQPEFMQRIAVIFPQFWAMKGLRSVVVANQPVSTVVKPIIYLLIIGTVFFIMPLIVQKAKKLLTNHA